MHRSRHLERLIARGHRQWWEEGLSAFEPQVEGTPPDQNGPEDGTAAPGGGESDWADLDFGPPIETAPPGPVVFAPVDPAELCEPVDPPELGEPVYPSEVFAPAGPSGLSAPETRSFLSVAGGAVRVSFTSILGRVAPRSSILATGCLVGALAGVGFLWQGAVSGGSVTLAAAFPFTPGEGRLAPMRARVRAVSPGAAATATAPAVKAAAAEPAPQAAPAVSASTPPASEPLSSVPSLVTEPPTPIVVEPPLTVAASVAAPDDRAEAERVPEVSGTPEDRLAVERAIRAYEQAHDRLDADAMAALVPSLDAPGLSAALDGASGRDVTFERCDYAWGIGRATAVCRGEVRYVRPDATEIRAAVWTFTLAQTDERWRIEHVIMR